VLPVHSSCAPIGPLLGPIFCSPGSQPDAPGVPECRIAFAHGKGTARSHRGATEDALIVSAANMRREPELEFGTYTFSRIST